MVQKIPIFFLFKEDIILSQWIKINNLDLV